MAQGLHSARRGDLIEFDRPLYQHWAVYVGNDEVVHLTTPDDKGPSTSGSGFGFSSSGSVAAVKRENIWKVAEGCLFKVNNFLDDQHKPRDPDVIVKEACKKVGEKLSYSVTAANCEHFVTMLRYGIKLSKQAIKGIATVGAGAIVLIGTSALAPATVAAAATYAALSWAFNLQEKSK